MHNAVQNLEEDLPTKQLLLRERRVVLYGLEFNKFRKEIEPLSYDEAKLCLGPLIMSAVKAIRSLHNFGFAHLDVYSFGEHLLQRRRG